MGRLETGPREVTAPELQREILQLEEQEGSLDYKFGVVYCREGQTSDDEMYSNGVHTSLLYECSTLATPPLR